MKQRQRKSDDAIQLSALRFENKNNKTEATKFTAIKSLRESCYCVVVVFRIRRSLLGLFVFRTAS